MPPILPKLTARQQQILDMVKTAIAEKGAPPTRQEIAQALGFKSPNAAEEHLRALARKGAIELLTGTSRGIRLPGDGLQQLHSAQGAPVLELPLIGRVAAGAPILAQAHIEASYRLGRHLFASAPDYLLKVRGLSMRDAGILDGDLLAVQRTSEVRSGQIIVARLGDEVTVKRLRRTAQSVILVAENPDYPPITVTPEQPFAVEGLVVGLIRNTPML